MSSISLQQDIIYGPVLSRRLGRSLGINLLPTDHKTCSFDCVYCQYGRTKAHTLSPDIKNLPSMEDILVAVEKALKKPHSIDFLTFSGNGEPTLHPDFPAIVREVRRLKEQLRPQAQLALLSNSSRVSDTEIIDALSRIDFPMMKLDAGDEMTFESINQPVQELSLQDIVKGLGEMSNLFIQSVLIDGDISNSRGEAYAQWAAVLADLRPEKVHIYSTERPTARDDVVCLSAGRLKAIQIDLQSQYGLDVDAFWRK